MKNIILSFLALVVLLFVSCKPDPVVVDGDATANIEVNFVAEYQNSPLVVFSEDYAYPESGNSFNVKKFQFLMTDFVLLKDGTSDGTELAEVEIVTFNDLNTADKAARGTSLAYQSIPVGEYSGIRFGLGVNRDLNKQESVTEVGAPLDQDWWQGWGSYIFTKMEGNFDTTGDGMYDAEDDIAYSLHTGSNDAFRTVTINAPFTVTADGDNIVKIVVDYGKILEGAEGQVYDLVATPQSHSTENFDAIIEIMDNFKDAFFIR